MTPTLSNRFTGSPMRYPVYKTPLVKRIAQLYEGMGDILDDGMGNQLYNGVAWHPTWTQKVENVQKDEQEAIRWIQLITVKYPYRVEEFMQQLLTMDDESYETSNGVFIIATDTMNDIVTQMRHLTGTTQAERDKQHVSTETP